MPTPRETAVGALYTLQEAPPAACPLILHWTCPTFVESV